MQFEASHALPRHFFGLQLIAPALPRHFFGLWLAMPAPSRHFFGLQLIALALPRHFFGLQLIAPALPRHFFGLQLIALALPRQFFWPLARHAGSVEALFRPKPRFTPLSTIVHFAVTSRSSLIKWTNISGGAEVNLPSMRGEATDRCRRLKRNKFR